MFEQFRYLDPEELNIFDKDLMDYLLNLKDKSESEFQVIQSNCNESSKLIWKYCVYLKSIVLQNDI